MTGPRNRCARCIAGRNPLERKVHRPSFGGVIERPAHDLNRRSAADCEAANHVSASRGATQVRRGVVSAAESTRVSPKVVRVSPLTFRIEGPQLVVRHAAALDPASRPHGLAVAAREPDGTLIFPCDDGSDSSLPKNTQALVQKRVPAHVHLLHLLEQVGVHLRIPGRARPRRPRGQTAGARGVRPAGADRPRPLRTGASLTAGGADAPDAARYTERSDEKTKGGVVTLLYSGFHCAHLTKCWVDADRSHPQRARNPKKLHVP